MRSIRKLVICFIFSVFFTPAGTLLAQDVLTLEEAIRVGLEGSYSIQIARNNAEIARLNNTMGNAGYLPRIDIGLNQSSNVQNRYQEYEDGSTVEASSFPVHNLNSGAQLNWTIFDGFAMFIRKEKLGLFKEQSDLYLRMEVENTVADIVYTYYNIALNMRLYQSYKQQLELSRERLKVAREKSKIGVGYGLQELQAEVDFRADSALFLTQRNRVVNSKADLNRLLIRDPNYEFSVDCTIPVPNEINALDVYQKVVDNNPSIQNARLLTRIGELDIDEARSARMPTVNLSGAYNFNRIGMPQGDMQINRTHGPVLGLGASVSIFNGFNVQRRIQNAKIMAENQSLSQQELELRLKNAAFKLVNELNQAIELVRVEERSVVLAQRNTDAAWERFQLGAISDLELRESQNKLLDAQTRLYSSQMRAQAAQIEILTLVGDMGGLF